MYSTLDQDINRPDRWTTVFVAFSTILPAPWNWKLETTSSRFRQKQPRHLLSDQSQSISLCLETTATLKRTELECSASNRSRQFTLSFVSRCIVRHSSIQLLESWYVHHRYPRCSIESQVIPFSQPWWCRLTESFSGLAIEKSLSWTLTGQPWSPTWF